MGLSHHDSLEVEMEAEQRGEIFEKEHEVDQELGHKCAVPVEPPGTQQTQGHVHVGLRQVQDVHVFCWVHIRSSVLLLDFMRSHTNILDPTYIYL